VEVTREDYQRYYDSTNRSRRLFSFRHLLSNKNKNSITSSTFSIASQDNQGVASVASSVTHTSNATIKASNRTAIKTAKDVAPTTTRPISSNHKVERPFLSKHKSDESASNKRSGWEKIMKRFSHSLRKQNGSIDDSSINGDSQTTISGSNMHRRGHSSASPLGRKNKMMHDDAIRGRLDGLDILSLGPARLTLNKDRRDGITNNQDDLLVESMNSEFTPSKMILDMIKLSAGREAPEMILEGFYPCDEGRWAVRIDGTTNGKTENVPIFSSGRNSPVPDLSPMDSYEVASPIAGCGKDNVSLTHLMENMWGKSEIPPTHQKPERSSSDQVDEDILELASQCNVPIDIDEDTFIVETAEHLQNVHSIATIPLQRGDFDHALKVFHKILTGLRLRHEGKPHYLIGATLHNIGIIQMWQGKFKEARQTFQEAVLIRKSSLNPQHEDVGVSLVRLGFTCLAIGQHTDAISSFQKALSTFVTRNASRAKTLNNLGVAQYLNKNITNAMKGLKSALEIQRNWLEGKIRRDSMIFDASITLSNMGKIHLGEKDFKTSVFVYEEALLLQTSVFRQDSLPMLLSLGNIAYAKAKNGDLIKAINIYKGLKRTFEVLHGKESRQYNEILGLLGNLQTQKGENKEAVKYLSSVLVWQQQNLGENSPYVKHTKNSLLTAQVDAEAGSMWA